jgi:hypothetical protein
MIEAAVVKSATAAHEPSARGDQCMVARAEDVVAASVGAQEIPRARQKHKDLRSNSSTRRRIKKATSRSAPIMATPKSATPALDASRAVH